ncbi:hypothetical protein KO561_03140 [Radiobacillus kanasensis]|uniref:hypothetical protein n=1 Tax=Radiobacillus kanasensis TaxID=2844358 RepID=UPI001E2D4875|nr:hypothetical protein [Radiobacillus kanasensis]UFT99972.1 hypothetical protein KO561_03140 [Radiobacillus kanasensis]
MSIIKIRPRYIKHVNNDLLDIYARLNDLSAELQSLQYSIDWEIRSRKGIDSRLNDSNHDLKELASSLRQLYSMIDYSIDNYIRTENYLTRKINFTLNQSKSPSNGLQAGNGNTNRGKHPDAIDRILNFFDSINKSMSKGDALLVGSQLASVVTSSFFSRGLMVHYRNGKPSFLRKVLGNYEFKVTVDRSWRNNSRYSNKIANKIHRFMTMTPRNGMERAIKSFLNTYKDPGSLLKHLAGFPKNSPSIMKGIDLSNSFQSRIKTGTKDVAEKIANARGFTSVAKKIPIVGAGISITANFSEFSKDSNKDLNIGEKTGRFFSGIVSDAGAIAVGAKIGAVAGGIGGPVGVVVGGAVGGLIGAAGSILLEDEVKDVGEKIGGAIQEGLTKTFSSIESWFS